MKTGYVDSVGREQISGWAADRDAPDDAVEIAVFINAREAGRVRADELRLDLRRLGQYGDGRHGFVFPFRPPLDPAEEYDVVVRIADSDTTLIHGAFKIGRATEPTDTAEPAPARADERARGPARDPRPRNPPRYVLHVGLPKTGTKYLQKAFWETRQHLEANGIRYPSAWWQAGPLFAHHELARELAAGPSDRIAEIFAQLNVCGADTVLLSCEGFAALPERGLAYLRDLIRGSRVEIVFYTRRWSDWIPSQWQQAVKQGSLQTLPEWYAFLLANADTHPGIDQAIFLQKFARVFGRSSLKLVSYSNLVDRGVDILQHFCNQFLALTDVVKPAQRNDLVHESMGIHLTELIRCINSLEIMESRKSGYHVFDAYNRISGLGEMKIVFEAMGRSTAELILDDSITTLRPVYARINDYRDRLVSPDYGTDVFQKRKRAYRFVRGDFLMADGVAPAVAAIARAVRARLCESAVRARPRRDAR